MKRHSKGKFYALVKKMKVFDHKFYFQQFHMTSEKLENLLLWWLLELRVCVTLLLVIQEV